MYMYIVCLFARTHALFCLQNAPKRALNLSRIIGCVPEEPFSQYYGKEVKQFLPKQLFDGCNVSSEVDWKKQWENVYNIFFNQEGWIPSVPQTNK